MSLSQLPQASTRRIVDSWDRDRLNDRKAVIEWGMKFLSKMTVVPVDDNAVENTLGINELYKLLKGEMEKVDAELFLSKNAPKAHNGTYPITPATAKQRINEISEQMKNPT